jgi:Zn-dependent protease/predicted transcriptional regulator
MSWSWKIGRVFGVDIHIHATFLILLAILVVAQYFSAGPTAALVSFAFISSLFACVLLHELGHALAAGVFHIPTRNILLLPIGGVARLERMPEAPFEEILIALAGPAVNLVLAAGMFLYLAIMGALHPIAHITGLAGSFPVWLLAANLMLALFNLLPAFPMDGGRVLRAVLSWWLGRGRATQVAAHVGQVFALLLGFVGLLTWNLIIIVIAFFIWVSGAQEAAAVRLREGLRGLPVSVAMQHDFKTLSPEDCLSDVSRMALDGFQHVFPVVEEGRPVGLLTHKRLLEGLAQWGPETPVGKVMLRDLNVVGETARLQDVLDHMISHSYRTTAIVKEGLLVGLVSPETIREFVLLRKVLGVNSPSAEGQLRIWKHPRPAEGD